VALVLPSLGRVARTALVAALLAGCAGAPSQSTPPASPPESGELFQRVVINAPGRGDHGHLVAYVGEKAVGSPGAERSITHVYDLGFKTIGFYLSDGATYRVKTDRNGVLVEENLGNHDPQKSIERICGVEGPIAVVPGL
jgi:hypothetical protein